MNTRITTVGRDDASDALANFATRVPRTRTRVEFQKKKKRFVRTYERVRRLSTGTP